MKNPIMYADPSGHFVITTATNWAAIGIGAVIGAGIGLGATVVKDLENGKLFDGDVTFLSYAGNFLDGGIGSLVYGFWPCALCLGIHYALWCISDKDYSLLMLRKKLRRDINVLS